MKPTVGRIVHFYTTNLEHQSNGQGEGPYPAIVTQTWPGPYINLKVFGYGIVRDEGSVEELKFTLTDGNVETGDGPVPKTTQSRWWVWPPRE